jgi:hypothetical protein
MPNHKMARVLSAIRATLGNVSRSGHCDCGCPALRVRFQDPDGTWPETAFPSHCQRCGRPLGEESQRLSVDIEVVA